MTQRTVSIGTHDDVLVYRQPRSRAELIDLLRLRHRAYCGTPLERFEPATDHGYHLDAWDPIAFHFGLYVRRDGIDLPVAYQRMIPNRPATDLGCGVRDSGNCLGSDDSVPIDLPLQRLHQAWRDPESLLPANARTGRLLEVSRTSVAPDCSGREVVLSVLTGTVIIGLGVLEAYAPLFLVKDRPARWYARLGFTLLSRRELPPPILGANLFSSAGIHARRTSGTAILERAREFRRTGEIVGPPLEILTRAVPCERPAEKIAS